jgi:hypothetical protein
VAYNAPLMSDVALPILNVANIVIAFFTLIQFNSRLIIYIISLGINYVKVMSYAAPMLSDAVVTLVIVTDNEKAFLTCKFTLIIFITFLRLFYVRAVAYVAPLVTNVVVTLFIATD